LLDIFILVKKITNLASEKITHFNKNNYIYSLEDEINAKTRENQIKELSTVKLPTIKS
jgi:hypothetical protein